MATDRGNNAVSRITLDIVNLLDARIQPHFAEIEETLASTTALLVKIEQRLAMLETHREEPLNEDETVGENETNKECALPPETSEEDEYVSENETGKECALQAETSEEDEPVAETDEECALQAEIDQWLETGKFEQGGHVWREIRARFQQSSARPKEPVKENKTEERAVRIKFDR